LNELLSITCSSSLHMSLPDCSVQCVVTSPPYWGLRKYDGEQDSGGFVFGLEPTPELYVEHTVLFLREIWRVLMDDGCCFWNIADSFWGSAQGYGTKNPTPKQASNTGTLDTILSERRPLTTGRHATLKPKDMCLIPFRVALAAQADGWWVRSDIIWAKPNPMPESVKDRPTSSYEHIFMFTKSSRYYWDADAVREPMAPESAARYNYPFAGAARDALIAMGDLHGEQFTNATLPNGRNIRDVWTIATQPSGFKHYAAFPEEIPTRCIKAATKMGDTVLDPFAGTGRTLEAALRLGRKAVGYDLSEKYCAMAQQRCDGVQVEIDGGRY
jgi:DNA modification methylase